MKRQDVNGVERLAVDDTGGGAGSDVNLTGIDGTAPSTGLGVADTGTLRVAISSDSPSTGNPAAGATGAAVPADADYQGLNVAGTLRGATGVNPSGSIFAEQVDLASIAGTTTATGNGVVSAGVQRVAIASDNTAFAVNATLQAGSAVVGHVITDTGSTTAVTGSVTVVQGTGTNLHTVIDSGTTTVTQGTGTNLHTVVDSGTITTVSTVTSVTNPVTVEQATASSLNATVVGTGTFAVQAACTGTVTASNTTGNIASDSPDSGNPVKIGMLAKSADITAVADADRVDVVGSLLGKPIHLPYSTPALTWSYAAAAGGLVTTGGVTAKAAGTGAQRHYVTRVQAINSHQTIGTEVVIRDGAAGPVLWRGWAQFAGGGCSAVFDPPLRGSAATLIEIAEITTTATAGVLVNLQGYTAAE